MAFLNLVRQTSATTGTGTVTLGAAVTGFLSVGQAGGVDGTIYSYAIEADYVTNVATSREVGHGILGGSGTTLTRVVSKSTNSNALLSLAGDAQVIIVVAAEDLIETVTALVDGASVPLDASLGDVFTLTALGSRTITAPTNPTSGQTIVIRHLASGGSRTLSLDSGTGGFRFGTTITALSATTSGLTDYIVAIYHLTDNKWDVTVYSKGY